MISRPDNLQPPPATGDLKMLAELTDHDLRLPAAGSVGSSESIRAWIGTGTGIESDGLILDPRMTSDPGFAEVLASARLRRPRMLIDAEPGLSADGEADLSLRLTRMIGQRFGESIRILPFYTESGDGAVRRLVSGMIRAVGAVEVAASSTSEPPDLLLFVVLPGTSPAGHQRLIDGIRLTIGRDVQVAIADLTTDHESKKRLFADLRHERWIDRLAAIAGSDPAFTRNDANTAARAIAQAVLFLTGIRSLRDDYDRLHRIDHARARLLLARCLSDYVYPLAVRGDLRDATPSEFERLASARLMPLASELFNEQFRRNIHATRLVTGDRARFEISLLQQLRLRFSSRDSVGGRPEILPSIHLAALVWPGTINRDGSGWEIKNDELDQRLRDRWREVPWERFAAGATRVEVTFRDAPRNATDSPEGYRIRSRLTRSTRRIEIFTTTDPGRSHAINRLARLGAGGELARDFDLSESPQFSERGIVDDRGGEWSLRERLDLIELLGRLRMNRYVLVLTPDEPAIDAESITQLRQRAERVFVSLTVVEKLPAGSRQLAQSAPCLVPVADPASILPTASARETNSVLIQPTGPPYSTWLRLASAAELAWNPASYRRERAAEYLLVGEEPEIIAKLRPLLPVAADCETGKPVSLSPVAANLIPRNGRRFLSLLRGELRQIAR